MDINSFLSQHKTQHYIDNKIGDIMKNLKTDEELLKVFELGLLEFLNQTMLSDRQIAKKMTSFSVNPLTGAQFTDRELNIMFYGQDLAASQIYIFNSEKDDYEKIPNPGYVPYFTEKEEMVCYGAGYEPIDIRDMVRKQIKELKKEIKKEIKSFENNIKEMVHNIPKMFTKINASTETVALMIAQQATVVLAPLAANPGMFTKIAMDLYEAATTLRKFIKEVLAATLILQAGNSMFGAEIPQQINVSAVIKPAINGSSPVKKLIKTSVDAIPKIRFVVPDEIHAIINDVVYAIMAVLDAASNALIAIDTAAVAAEAAALYVGPPPDAPSAAILVAQVASVLVFNDAIKAAYSTAQSAISKYLSQATKG